MKRLAMFVRQSSDIRFKMAVLRGSASLVRGPFSHQALEAARMIGAADLLDRIPTLEEEAVKHREHAALSLLQVRQELSDRIQLTLLDVARTAAEADYEEERADQLADRLQEVRDTRVRHLTLFAIIIDALIGAIELKLR